MKKENFLPTLEYRGEEDHYFPMPPSEQLLQTVTALPWMQVPFTGDTPAVLEGLQFDRDGNLWFIENLKTKVHKVNMETGEDTIVYEDPERNLSFGACKIHKDGTIFLPSVGNMKAGEKHGYIYTMNPDGTNFKTLMEGHIYDDIVFDNNGGFYYTHFTGNVDDNAGGVYYVSPDFKTVTPLLENLAGANGVAISKDGSKIWITETNRNRLLRVELMPGGGPTDIKPYGVCVAYYFTGCEGPDSCYVDNDDNVYVAMCGQARVMVFNKYGFPIGQVLLPGRENENMKECTHPQIRPGTNELYICTHDVVNGGWIFKAGAFAIANENGFQFQD